MANFWNIGNKVIYDADILLLILDARQIDETRNNEIEDKVKRLKKPLIYVITKSDLVDKEVAERHKKSLKNSVFVSAKFHHGTKILRDRILIAGKRAYKDKEKFKVGVLGYPNVGKSSLINAMKGKKAARTSILSGYTRGVQNVRMDNKITMIDTPGVIPYQEKDAEKHILTGTIDFTKTKDPELAVMTIMSKYPGKIESYYEVVQKEDPEEVLEEIALKKNILIKGGKPDTQRASRMILKDWQKGDIKL